MNIHGHVSIWLRIRSIDLRTSMHSVAINLRVTRHVTRARALTYCSAAEVHQVPVGGDACSVHMRSSKLLA